MFRCWRQHYFFVIIIIHLFIFLPIKTKKVLLFVSIDFFSKAKFGQFQVPIAKNQPSILIFNKGYSYRPHPHFILPFLSPLFSVFRTYNDLPWTRQTFNKATPILGLQGFSNFSCLWILTISYPEQLATLFDFTDGRVTNNL